MQAENGNDRKEQTMRVEPSASINAHDRQEVNNLLEWRKRKKKAKKKTQNADFAVILEKTLKK